MSLLPARCILLEIVRAIQDVSYLHIAMEMLIVALMMAPLKRYVRRSQAAFGIQKIVLVVELSNALRMNNLAHNYLLIVIGAKAVKECHKGRHATLIAMIIA